MLVAAGAVYADWDIGDGHKMHFPQLPKVDGGWDVMSSYYLFLADDWQCSQTGYVNDIHVWVSYRNDEPVDPLVVHLAIWTDDPVGNSGIPGEDPANQFSKPLEQVWHGDTSQWTTRWWADGPQGWFDPRDPAGTMVPPTVPDHWGVYQMNFLYDDQNAFLQEEGHIYWLEFTVQQPVEVGIGWKESADAFQDDATWRIEGGAWNELIDPVTSESMNLAFVITPEPGTMMLMLLGVVGLLRRRG
jgi:hypothetical protein